jgi:ornithine cyclodeaminase/alanine dehydrogenase-like protein (mu-crystallin family)
MLFLNKEDILSLTDFSSVMDEIERAYSIHEDHDFFMPPRTHVNYGEKTLLYMPCFLPDIFGTKMLTVFPENAKLKKPAIDGLMVLNDRETGETLAILDGQLLTSLRTGAVGGLSIRHLTPKNISKVGVIGAGAQGFYQALYACAERDIKKLYLYDPFNTQLSDFIERLKNGLGDKKPEIIACKSAEELVGNCEVIITATTSKQPVIPNDPELLKGRHFVGIGSYKLNMREYPDALFKAVKQVYVDLDFAKEETGDLAYPLADELISDGEIISFGWFLRHEANKEGIANEGTFFKTVGMALFDLVVAQHIFKRAKEKGIGQQIKL